MFKKILAVAASVAVFSGSAVAGAVSVSDVHGKVLVNVGAGFVPFSGQSLNVGDSVMVGDQSFATLSFDGCAVALDSPTVFTVSKAAPCAGGSSASEATVITPTAGPLAIPFPALFFVGAVVVGSTLVVTGVIGDDEDGSL